MSTDDREYVLAGWGADDGETEVFRVELPAREVVVQLEVPRTVVERTTEIADDHGLPVATVLAERLERNRARISLLAAKSASETDTIRDHLADTRAFLSGVEHLDTETIEREIEVVWARQLDSA